MHKSIHKNIFYILITVLPGCKPDASSSNPDKDPRKPISSVPATNQQNPIPATPPKSSPVAKKPVADLSLLTDPSARKNAISAVISNSNPDQILEFLTQNQRFILEKDIEFASLWVSQLENLDKETLVDGVNKIRNPSVRRLLFRALSGKIPLTSGLTELKTAAGQFSDESAMNGFLRIYMESAIQANPAETLVNFSQLKDLNPQPGSVSWYNQLLADTARNLPLNKVNGAWKSLSLVKDETTRTIAAQVLFGIRWEADSLEATAWLDSLEASNDKTSAVRSLVNQLEMEGDHESAETWKKILPDKYK